MNRILQTLNPSISDLGGGAFHKMATHKHAYYCISSMYIEDDGMVHTNKYK
jgi:hypothetical protein